MTDRILVALLLVAAGCASAKPAGRPAEAVVHAKFASDDDLKAWRITGGEWYVTRGAAMGRQVGTEPAYLTWPVYFGEISSVTIRGGIASRQNLNFRVAIGNLSAIFNWEQDDVNVFREQTLGDPQKVAPRALSPGGHVIRFLEQGGVIRVMVDEHEVWETAGRMRGTVTIYPAAGSIIRVEDVEIVGTPVPWIAVDGPSMRAP